jgi:polysaccharide export outer membrane protein
MRATTLSICVLALVAIPTLARRAQTPAAAQAPAAPAPASPQKPAQPVAQPPVVPQGITPPADYVIGPEDVLQILFWREKELSAEASVRPDGRITLPLINDIQAAGLTTDQLRERVQEAAARYVETPNATIVVKAINSRKVFVTGKVAKPGTYPLMGPTTVLQMIATAGGLMDFAKGDRIVVMRTQGGKTETFKFNYKDVAKSKKLEQNIELKPGDTILVP